MFRSEIYAPAGLFPISVACRIEALATANFLRPQLVFRLRCGIRIGIPDGLGFVLNGLIVCILR